MEGGLAMPILSTDLIKEFVESTHDEAETKSPSRFYGTASVRADGVYVIFDGSTIPTPVSMATDAQTGDRVLVEVVDHKARVIQNTNKSNSDIVADRIENDETGVFQELRVGKEYVDSLVASDITADTIVADRAKIEKLEASDATISGKLTAAEADIEDLKASDVEIGKLIADKANISDLTAIEANISDLQAEDANIKELVAGKASISDLNAATADIDDLKAADATITGKLDAVKANIESLDAEFVQLDFANIDNAWIERFFSESGIIKDLVIGEATVTGHLVGVTISGDLIEGNTVKADKLVVKGEDGLYYKLNIEGGSTVTEQLTKEMLQNGLDGNNIIANTITAEKISVDDLIAFDATIGGFNIGTNSIYSGVKSSINNTTRGIYLDTEGQIYFGDADNYIRYYKTKDGNYKLAITGKSVVIGTSGTNIEEAFDELRDAKIDRFGTNASMKWDGNVLKIEATDPETNVPYAVEIGGNGIEFKYDNEAVAMINQDQLVIDKTVVLTEMQVNRYWTWRTRDNNNLCLQWIGESN